MQLSKNATPIFAVYKRHSTHSCPILVEKLDTLLVSDDFALSPQTKIISAHSRSHSFSLLSPHEPWQGAAAAAALARRRAPAAPNRHADLPRSCPQPPSLLSPAPAPAPRRARLLLIPAQRAVCGASGRPAQLRQAGYALADGAGTPALVAEADAELSPVHGLPDGTS